MKTNIIEGNPTKKFFIEMITRDISIEDAIIDLLDNSIDGANRIDPNNYSGLNIYININEDRFEIMDNCGGFSIDTAKKYAFRFGRPEDAPKENGTVGRFGIGMKRSLFKIGKKFSVESQHKDDSFRVEVDVDDWSKKVRTIQDVDGTESTIDDWSFTYEELSRREDVDGTKIVITNLNSEVRDLFADDSFLNTLSDNIQKLLNFSMQKGLEIFLNGRQLQGKKIEILLSDQTLPYYAEGQLERGNNVKYRLVAGLGGVGEPKLSGWYIYCNDRLVLDADTSSITGWGVQPIPQWHINYVMFRGILFLDAEETLDLPLTTTKKGIDATSEVYKAILPLMRQGMLKVFEFLKKIPQMGDEANAYRTMLWENTTKISVVDLKTVRFPSAPKVFVAPQLDVDVIATKKNTVRIAYDVAKRIAELAKEHAEAKSYKELGTISFEYYLKMEDIANEECDGAKL